MRRKREQDHILSPPPLLRHRAQLSCDECRTKKRKCDRRQPCSQCQFDSSACTYARAIMTSKEKSGKEKDSTCAEDSNSAIPTHTYSAGTSQMSNDRIDIDLNALEPLFPSFVEGTSDSGPFHLDAHMSASDYLRIAETSNNSSNTFEMPQIQDYLRHPFFIYRSFLIYLQQIDWMSDLVIDTRIHEILEENARSPLETCALVEIEVIHVLIHAILAVTAQICPIEFEALLSDVYHEAQNCKVASLEESIWSAFVYANLSYKEAKQTLVQADMISKCHIWPAEHYAASLLLRLFEKNEGSRIDSSRENVLIDTQRLQRAGFQYKDRCNSRAIIGHGLLSSKDRLLTYRIFWAYLDKDRIISFITDSGYTFHAQHCTICLRGPTDEHFTVEHFFKTKEFGNEALKCSYCTCMDRTENAALPSLSYYSFNRIQISAIIGHIYNEMTVTKDISFQWPYDADNLITVLEDKLERLETQFNADKSEKKLSQEQWIFLRVIVAEMRCHIAKKLFQACLDRFENDLVLSWPFQKKQIDTKISLLNQSRSFTSTLTLSRSCSTFVAKFIFEQLLGLIQETKSCFIHFNTFAASESRLVSEYVYTCLVAIIDARNTLTILTRKSDSIICKRQISISSKAVVELIHLMGLQGEEVSQSIIEVLKSTCSLVNINHFNRIIRSNLIFNKADFNWMQDLTQAPLYQTNGDGRILTRGEMNTLPFYDASLLMDDLLRQEW